MIMMRCSLDDRGAVRFVGIPQGAETGGNGAGAQFSPGLIHAAEQRAAIDRGRAPVRMRQTELDLFPQQPLAFAPIVLLRIAVHDRYHAAVDLGDHRGRAVFTRPSRLVLAKHRTSPRVALCDRADRARRKLDAVVLEQLLARLGEGQVCGKVHQRTLQWPRTAAMMHRGTLAQRAPPSRPLAVLWFLDFDVAEKGMPAEFFLPSRHTPVVPASSSPRASTCSLAQRSNTSWPSSRISSITRCSAASASPNTAKNACRSVSPR
jgi:hypothetical protein